MSIDSILLPYQQKWLSDPSPVKFWEKSRRIGATWCEAADAVLIAGRKNNPMDYYYTSVNEQLSREFIRDAGEWAKRFEVAITDVGESILKDGEKSIRVQQIILTTGKKIMGLPNNPSVLRGRQGVYLADEFAFLENPAENLKAAMAFLMWGGKVRVLSTHNGENSHFNLMIKEIRAGKLNYSLHRTTLDDALNEGLYQRICQKNKQSWSNHQELKWRDDLINFYGIGADEELFCVPTNSSGTYFTRVMVERCMTSDIPVVNLTLKDKFLALSQVERKKEIQTWMKESLDPLLKNLHPHYKTSYGFDFGRSGDLSYLLPFQELPNLVRKAPFALELRNVPHEEQKQILFHVIKKLPRFSCGAHDARGNGESLAEAAATKFGKHRIEQVKLTLDWYRNNMPKYKAGLEDRKVLLPADSNLLDDHRAIEVIDGVPKLPKKKNKGDDGKSRHGDGVIAAALAWFASSQYQHNSAVAIGSISQEYWG